MFCTGTYERNLDDKQRLLLPKSVKRSLEVTDCLFLTPGQDNCLELHNRGSIERRYQEVSQSPSSRTRKSFSRLFFAQAEKCEPDSQNRIRIPQRLMEWSKLENRVVILGVGEYWEIWSEVVWNDYRLQNKAEFDGIAEGLLAVPAEFEVSETVEKTNPTLPR